MIPITGIPGGITLPGMEDITVRSVLAGIRTSAGTSDLATVGVGILGILTTCMIPGMLPDPITITNLPFIGIAT